MKVEISDAAYADLFEIGRFIAGDNPTRAETFVAEIHERCHSLGDAPKAFPLVPKWESQGIRRRVYGNYLIFYRIGAGAVQIIRILHGARDYEAILFPGEH